MDHADYHAHGAQGRELMLTVNRVTKQFNLSPILLDITFSLAPGERAGLIGPNGSGKTTLLRIIAGHESADSGHVQLTPSNLKLGYLAQGFELDPALTLADVRLGLVDDPHRLEDELARLATALAADPDQADLQRAYDQTLNRLAQPDRGGVVILANLGLDGIDPQQRVGTLSGGQKTRLALALTLLSEPDVLLLDEPTNHLDIPMLEWLEEWLADYPGAALVVSHDRTFLDRTTNRILDLDPARHTLREYDGNYSAYLEQYLAERERQLSAWKDQEYEIRRVRQDIARTKEQARHVEITTKPNQPGVRRIAKKVARKAGSREKKLERYLASDERVAKPGRSWQMKLDFEEARQAHIGRDVLALHDLTVGFAGRPLLSGVNLTIRAGERVVLTGPNGSGKTTLLRTIAGVRPPLTGRVRLGESARLGYMTQEQEALDPAATALETILHAAPMTETEARSFLHYFLFEGDDSLRPIADLSFGERSRLALAVLAAEGCTFLLLDEPINHLDIPSRTRFEEALTSYPGTILAVVHDRYFIERLATEIWQIVDGRIEASKI